MGQDARFVISPPRHDAPSDLRKASKEVFTIENISEQALGCLAQHHSRKLGTAHSVNGNSQASLTKQAQAAKRRDPLALDQHCSHRIPLFHFKTGAFARSSPGDLTASIFIAISQLLDNACKYSELGSTINLSVEHA